MKYQKPEMYGTITCEDTMEKKIVRHNATPAEVAILLAFNVVAWGTCIYCWFY
jgi:hypothetical protein